MPIHTVVDHVKADALLPPIFDIPPIPSPNHSYDDANKRNNNNNLLIQNCIRKARFSLLHANNDANNNNNQEKENISPNLSPPSNKRTNADNTFRSGKKRKKDCYPSSEFCEIIPNLLILHHMTKTPSGCRIVKFILAIIEQPRIIYLTLLFKLGGAKA